MLKLSPEWFKFAAACALIAGFVLVLVLRAAVFLRLAYLLFTR